MSKKKNYIYKGKIYELIGLVKIKCYTSGGWYDGVVYKQIPGEMIFCRGILDFEKKFIPVEKLS